MAGLMMGGGGPDLAAVGNAATVSKKSAAAPQTLKTFVVKRGDDGGVLVCETYEKNTPPGRRASSFPGGSDYQEHPFTPEQGAEATTYVGDLLTQMGMATALPEAPEAPPAMPAMPPGA